jgi:signal transduction histidine kinase
LRDGQQEFLAYAYDGGITERPGWLVVGSRIRIEGIAVSEAAYIPDAIPFVILMRSSSDVALVAPRPWWSITHVIELLIAVVLVSLGAHYLLNLAHKMRVGAVLQERQRLAMEMHDSLAQSFAGIGFRLEALRASTHCGGALEAQLAATLDLVRSSHREARRNIAAIRPGELEETGLLLSLQNAARAIVQDGSVRVHATREGVARQIPLEVAVAFLRIGQEAIANSVRHAHPTIISIHLAFDPSRLELTVSDDGEGFVYDPGSGGYGILGMQQRAIAIDAEYAIHSLPGQGTVVTVRSKLRPPLWGRSLLRRSSLYRFASIRNPVETPET